MRPSAKRARERRARRAAPLLAIAGVLIHLVGTLGGYLHFALVEHERCPEHGELVHADPREQPTGANRAAADRSLPSTPAVAPGSSSGKDSHDPCSIDSALRQRAEEPSAGRGELIDPLCEPVPAPVAEAPFLAGLRGYRLAPKTSPPALA